MPETLTDNELLKEQIEREKRNNRLGDWKPSNILSAQQRANWCEKQADQQQKTLELDGVTHSREYKEYLREMKKVYEEEAKRLRDYVADGGR